jgi:hypothetical protein
MPGHQHMEADSTQSSQQEAKGQFATCSLWIAIHKPQTANHRPQPFATICPFPKTSIYSRASESDFSVPLHTTSLPWINTD